VRRDHIREYALQAVCAPNEFLRSPRPFSVLAYALKPYAAKLIHLCKGD
jgi:hypothetical protein